MRQTRRARFAPTTEKLSARVFFRKNLRSVAAILCTSLLTFNTATPLCFAQASAGASHSSAPKSNTSQSPTSSPDAPDIVAPVSPPPAAPQSAGKTKAATGSAATGNSATGNKLPPNYDPLKPCHTHWRDRSTLLALDSENRRTAAKNVQTTAALSRQNRATSAAGTKVKPITPTQPHSPPVRSTAVPPVSPKPSGSTPASGVTVQPNSPAANQSLLKPQVPKVAEPLPAPDINKAQQEHSRRRLRQMPTLSKSILL